jgi:ferredoxin
MFEFPKLVVLILVFAAIWIAYRWLNGPARALPRRRAPQPRRAIPAEDLVACGVCGAYVAAHAPACVRPDCPQPR